MNEDFTTYPDWAGFKGTADTGREAAAAMNEKLGRLQNMVIRTVGERKAFGASAEEAADINGCDRVSIQPRFSECRAKGLIVDSGMRRPNPSSGKMAVVWVLPEFGPQPADVCEGA